jgi:hypothetical protein
MPAIARSFEHQSMKAAAVAFTDISRRPASVHWLHAHLDVPIASDLVLVCEALGDLQERRHKADYDIGASFTRTQADSAVSVASQAHSLWSSHRSTHNAHVFILLAAKLLRTR